MPFNNPSYTPYDSAMVINNHLVISEAGLKERADSVHAVFKTRTRQLARNVGDDSTLGKFLLKLYPEEKQSL